jgi:tRNA(adenine34) deaminase
MNTTEKMRLTLELAEEAMGNGECPIAAIVFLDNEIIAKSYTSENADKRLLVHAELKALIEVDMKRYSYDERKRMQLFTNLEPCMMCLGTAMSLFIGEIYYALESPSDGAVNIAKMWNPQSDDFSAYRLPKIYGGILRKNSQELFLRYIEVCEPGAIRDFAKSLTL